MFGLKHAVEADHLAAVSTIVSERKSLLSSSLVGGLWGIGHTISLLIAGAAVLLFQVKISERAAMALEFCVALMLIGLGANALRKLLGGGTIHTHSHRHSNRGMVHGLAGSAALMLLVLSTVSSRVIGLAFIVVFGLGSIGGMMIMSAPVSMPLRLTADRFKRTHRAVQMLAAIFSLGLGVMMVYHIGFLDGLFA